MKKIIALACVISIAACMIAQGLQTQQPKTISATKSDVKNKLKKGAKITGLAAVAVPSAVMFTLVIFDIGKAIYTGEIADRIKNKTNVSYELFGGTICGYALYQSIKDIKAIMTQKNNPTPETIQ